MRATIRFSVDGEKDNKLGLKLRKVLEGDRFNNKFNTGTYENNGISVMKLGFVLEEFFRMAADHKGPGNPGKLDHFWMYTHKKKSGKKDGKIGLKRKPRSKRETI